MLSTEIHRTIALGPYAIQLQIGKESFFASVNGEIFVNLWLLVQELPLLSEPIYMNEFAQISNFFWKGPSFEVIDNIPEYQNYYLKQVALEKKHSPDVFPYRLTDYRIFDVSVMHDPELLENQLSYFVYQTNTGIPYRVNCPFPYRSTSTFVHYKILPILE